jgi:hypothetical protein
MKALLTEAHPLAGQPEVHRQVEADQCGEPGGEADGEADAHHHLAPHLQRREERRVGQHDVLQEILVPADRIARRELGDPLGMKGDEARRDRRIRQHVPGESHGELGPHRLEEPRTDDHAQQCEPGLSGQHERGQCT